MGLHAMKMTLTEFIAWEDQQPLRHEFHRGDIYARVGGRRAHGRVTLNLGSQLDQRLDGSPCQVFTESMKVQIDEDTILYPDVLVTCDPEDLRTEQIFRSPRLVIEVLSPGTARYDRGAKLALYRGLESLQEILLIDPDSRAVHAFLRDDAGTWCPPRDMTGRDVLPLRSLGLEIPMSLVFKGVDPEAVRTRDAPPSGAV